MTHEYVWKDLGPTMRFSAEGWLALDESERRYLRREEALGAARLVIDGAEDGHNAPAGRKE